MTTPELPPLKLPALPSLPSRSLADHERYIIELREVMRCRERLLEARERIFQARIAEQDHVIAIARQNAELLTGYWKAAVAEVKALRAEMKAHGLTPEGDDDVDGW